MRGHQIGLRQVKRNSRCPKWEWAKGPPTEKHTQSWSQRSGSAGQDRVSRPIQVVPKVGMGEQKCELTDLEGGKKRANIREGLSLKGVGPYL